MPICTGAEPTDANEADDRRPVEPPVISGEGGAGEMGANVCFVISELSDDVDRGESEDIDETLVMEFRLLNSLEDWQLLKESRDADRRFHRVPVR